MSSDDTEEDLSLADAIAAGEAAMAELAPQFLGWVKEDIARARAHVEAAAGAADQASRDGEFREAFEAAHVIKGQGSSFGYPLMTEVAHTLCRLLRKADGTDERHVKVAQMHVNALELIVSQDIKGDGGPTGEALRAKLTKLVDDLGAGSA